MMICDRCRNSAGQLESNFDKDLLRLFTEVRYWEKVGGEFPIPYAALEMASKQEELRMVRENVMLVVRDYNTILDALGTEERRLFGEHLRHIDRKISPALKQLTWASKHVKEYFVKQGREICAAVQEIVWAYKEVTIHGATYRSRCC